MKNNNNNNESGTIILIAKTNSTLLGSHHDVGSFGSVHGHQRRSPVDGNSAVGSERSGCSEDGKETDGKEGLHGYPV